MLKSKSNYRINNCDYTNGKISNIENINLLVKYVLLDFS